MNMKKGDKVVFVGNGSPHYYWDTEIPNREKIYTVKSINAIGLIIVELPFIKPSYRTSPEWRISSWRKVDDQPCFKEIAELAVKHLETERSPHRKTSTDPAKERIFTTEADF